MTSERVDFLSLGDKSFRAAVNRIAQQARTFNVFAQINSYHAETTTVLEKSFWDLHGYHLKTRNAYKYVWSVETVSD